MEGFDKDSCHTYILSEIERRDDLFCPVDWDFTIFTMGSPVKRCEDISTYEPVIKRAKELAAKIFERMNCPLQCPKGDFVEIIGQQWRCAYSEGTLKPVAQLDIRIKCPGSD